MSERLRLLCGLTGLLAMLLLSGCNDSPNAATKKEATTPKPHLVEIVEAKPEQISSAHVRTGSLKVRRTVRIHTQEEGQITALPFYEGDAVTPGQELVRLDDALLQAQLTKARANSRQARTDLQRLQGLVKRRAASRDELLKAQTALEVAEAEQKLLETRLGFTRIHAPFEGVISERLMEPGDLATRNSHLLTLIDPDSLVIEIHLSELLLPHLQPGDPAQVRIDALGKQLHPGTILRIHPELDPLTRQGLVEVVLDPIPAGARAGQFVRVTLETARAQRMLVPFGAVRRDREGAFVYRLDDQNHATRSRVTTGIRVRDRIEILDGLEPGAQVISRGFLGLSDNKLVAPVNKPE